MDKEKLLSPESAAPSLSQLVFCEGYVKTASMAITA